MIDVQIVLYWTCLPKALPLRPLTENKRYTYHFSSFQKPNNLQIKRKAATTVILSNAVLIIPVRNKQSVSHFVLLKQLLPLLFLGLALHVKCEFEKKALHGRLMGLLFFSPCCLMKLFLHFILLFLSGNLTWENSS